jgi:5'(3')-deoxyribonucleotidase
MSGIEKPIVYVDMDGTLVDFDGYFAELPLFDGIEPDLHPLVFAEASPMPGAVETLNRLAPHFELFILTTSPWNNPSAASQKIAWIKKHFGDGPDSIFYKKVILSHKKCLNRGDYLIDDRMHPGFEGEHLHFGVQPDGTARAFPNWASVETYLLNKLTND